MTTATARHAADAPATPGASRVPQVTALFWIVKVLTTGTGETTSDFLVHRISPVVAVLCGAAAFGLAMWWQLAIRRYRAVTYWLAVLMVSVFGTMAADVLHIGLGIPYAASTVFFAAVLTVVFVLWRRSEGTLSIHSITTRRRELFYWAAVLTTFALGTATGDLTAVPLHLGYFSSGLLFTVAIAVPAVAWWRWRLDPVLAFWTAYVLTRPVGASFADWLGVSHARGGLALGTGPVSVVLTLVIAVLVGYLAVSRIDVEEPASRHVVRVSRRRG